MFTDKLRADYKIPSLVLKNVEITNLLHNYDSLIHVENDNLNVNQDDFGQKVILHYGNHEAQANITIIDSKIQDCSFARGMINLGVVPEFSDLKRTDVYYDVHGNEGAQRQHIEEMKKKATIQKKIRLYNNRFSNLNYG